MSFKTFPSSSLQNHIFMLLLFDTCNVMCFINYALRSSSNERVELLWLWSWDVLGPDPEYWWTGGAGWSDADTTGATGAVHWCWSLHLTVWRQHIIIISSEEQILLQLAFSATYKELMRFNSDLLRTWLCNNMNNQKKSGQKIIIKECRFRIFLLKIIKNY